MVRSHGEKHGPIHQKRERPPRERGEHGGPPPHAGEVVGRDELPYQATGADALSPLLMRIDFPATKEELSRAIGQARIPIDRTRTKRVDDVLDALGPQTFRSSHEVEEALKSRWPDIAEWEGRGGRPHQRDDLHGREPN